MPSDDASKSIINFLSEFAVQTRFFNLDTLTSSQPLQTLDPIKRWSVEISAAIMKQYDTVRQSERRANHSKILANTYVPAFVNVTSGAGLNLTNVHPFACDELTARDVNKHAQFVTLTIMRHLSEVLISVSDHAHGPDMPTMNDQIGFFCNEDKLLKSYNPTESPCHIPITVRLRCD